MENIIHVTAIDLDGIEHQLELPTDMGLNLMEGIRASGLSIKATCGGMAMCATCNIHVISGKIELPDRSEEEEDMLDDAFVLDIEGSRLSCQIPVTEQIDGLQFKLGPLTEE